MNQKQIEIYVGITPEIAYYMMDAETCYAKNAMSFLTMAVSNPDHVALTLLQEAVKDCEKDILANKE